MDALLPFKHLTKASLNWLHRFLFLIFFFIITISSPGILQLTKEEITIFPSYLAPISVKWLPVSERNARV